MTPKTDACRSREDFKDCAVHPIALDINRLTLAFVGVIH